MDECSQSNKIDRIDEEREEHFSYNILNIRLK